MLFYRELDNEKPTLQCNSNTTKPLSFVVTKKHHLTYVLIGLRFIFYYES